MSSNPSARTYRIQKASEFSGVSVDLIRAWEKRYGVLTPRRTPSGYRMYDDDDIAVLKRLKQLVDDGMSISQAAKLVGSVRAQVANPDVVPASGQTERWRQELLSAGEELDQKRVHRTLDEALAILPPLRVFDEVIAQVLNEIGDKWHAGKWSVAQEHLVSQAVRTRLLAVLNSSTGSDRRHVLCACFPDEQHELGLLSAALRFRNAGWRVTYFGQRMPAEELTVAASRIGAELVALSAVQDDGAQMFRERLEKVRKALPKGVALMLGGRAAIAHADVCAELHVSLVRSEKDWVTLVV